MFRRFIQAWIPEVGNTSIGQYLLILVILIIVTIAVFSQFGESVVPTFGEVFTRIMEGFSN